MDRVRASRDQAMTTVFAAIGEHRDDPDRLLLLGADGHHYAYPLPDGPASPVEPGDEWLVDEAAPGPDEIG